MKENERVSVCALIGRRIRERRKLLGMNQTQLAERMGFSYQQVQKYESGLSELSAGKLLIIARILDVTPNYFYDGIQCSQETDEQLKINITPKGLQAPFNILLIEDDAKESGLFRKALSGCSLPTYVHMVQDVSLALQLLKDTQAQTRHPTNIVILAMPWSACLGVTKILKSMASEIPVLILTEPIGRNKLHAAYRQGVAGFICKSEDMQEYTMSVELAMKYWSRIAALPN